MEQFIKILHRLLLLIWGSASLVIISAEAGTMTATHILLLSVCFFFLFRIITEQIADAQRSLSDIDKRIDNIMLYLIDEQKDEDDNKPSDK